MHHVALELLHEKCLKEEYKRNVIEFNNYFRYSGKEEKLNLKVAYLIEKEKRHRAKFAVGINNDMSGYKLKKDMYAKLIAEKLILKRRLKKIESELKKEKSKSAVNWNTCNKKLIDGHWYIKGSDVLMND